MLRIFRLTVVATLLLGGCQANTVLSHPRFGTPDLIGETAGDEARYYLPAHRPDYRWPEAERTYYFLAQRKQVVMIPGQRERVLALDEETEGFVRRSISDLQATSR